MSYFSVKTAVGRNGSNENDNLLESQDLSMNTAVGAMQPANMFTIIRKANLWKKNNGYVYNEDGY